MPASLQASGTVLPWLTSTSICPSLATICSGVNVFLGIFHVLSVFQSLSNWYRNPRSGQHLTREWNRLLERGGHLRRTKEPRPLSAKTVRNIAGVVSSAFARAIRWGLISTNPVTNSEPLV